MGTNGSMRKGVHTWRQNVNGSPIETPVTRSSLMCMGTEQTRNPEPSGSFVPGVFRVNPVIIQKSIGECTSAKLHGKTAPQYASSSVPWYENWSDGELMSLYCTFLPTAVWQQNVADWAIQEAYAALNEPQSDVALMLAEGAQTMRMLTNPLQALSRALAKVKTKRISPGAALGDVVEGSWLQWQYGVLPLMSDIQSIIELAKDGIRKNTGGLIRFRGGGSGKKQTAYSDIMGSQFKTYFYFDVRRRVEVEYKATANVYAQMVMDNDMKQSLGFDPRQIPALAWELVPYSFVVDWFMNVGSWIRAFTPLGNLSPVGNCVSLKSTCVLTIEGTSSWYSRLRSGTQSTDCGKYTCTVERLERRTNLNLPALPALSMNPLSLTRAISATALAWQQIPRKWKWRG